MNAANGSRNDAFGSSRARAKPPALAGSARAGLRPGGDLHVLHGVGGGNSEEAESKEGVRRRAPESFYR